MDEPRMDHIMQLGLGFWASKALRIWMKEVGFRETCVEHLEGPDSMVIGIK